MLNQLPTSMQPAEPRPVLPPEEERNIAQRILAANECWKEALDAARRYDPSNVANGTLIFLHMSRFFHELFGAGDPCGRCVQHVEQKLREDRPGEQGRLSL